jgi:broad specificity phosphatase PhoE
MAVAGVGKTVHFFRHGHATSNADVERVLSAKGIGHDLISTALSGSMGVEVQIEALEAMQNPRNFDADLTELGVEQANALRSSAERPQGAELIMSSSLRRAMRTAQLAFGDIVARTSHGKIILTDLTREYKMPKYVNSRPAVGEMRTAFGDSIFDYAALSPEDAPYTPGGEDPSTDIGAAAVTARARAAWLLLLTRPERSIVMVMHGSFLGNEMLGDPVAKWLDRDAGPTNVQNCEALSVRVESWSDTSSDGDGGAQVGLTLLSADFAQGGLRLVAGRRSPAKPKL